MQINATTRLASKAQQITAAITDAIRKKFCLALRKNSEFFSAWLYSKQGFFLVSKKTATPKAVIKDALAAFKTLGWKLVKRDADTNKHYLLRNNEWLVTLEPKEDRVLLQVVSDTNTLTKEVKEDKAAKSAKPVKAGP